MHAHRQLSALSALWYAALLQKVEDGTRSTGTRDAYERALRNHVLPALKEIRFGEFSVPLVDKVIKQIKKKVGVPTAQTSRSVISGVCGLAVRHGAMETNPVREIERIEGGKSKRNPRALEADERRMWFEMLSSDPKAVEADLFDLTVFMLGTGVRIGETLGVIWEQVNSSPARLPSHIRSSGPRARDCSALRRRLARGSGCSKCRHGASRCCALASSKGSG